MRHPPPFIISAAAGRVLAFSTLAQATSDVEATTPGLVTPPERADGVGRPPDDRNEADLETTARIRAEILAAADLSESARNVTILSHGGKVTLRGPVRSAGERRRVAELADQVARHENVDDQLEVIVDTGRSVSAHSEGE